MSRELNDIAEYYSRKLAQHGETPQGVDWNGPEGQQCRFEQLLKIIDGPGEFSINDLGCGYGALLDYIISHSRKCRYLGFDIAADMIENARNRCRDQPGASFHVGSVPSGVSDYSVASGIFNVRLQRDDAGWWDHITTTLEVMNQASRRGFAFNCLTSYSDAHKMRDHLYYADPCVLFDWCKRRYSRQVALLHDYGLYEFTILVRKEA